jgi:flagellar biogenesis protein FliO
VLSGAALTSGVLSGGDVAAKITATLLALVLVLLLAWLVLRWMSHRVPGVGGGSSRGIKVIDRLAASRGSTLLLLRVKDKILLVAVGDHGAQKLYEFDDPDGTFDLKGPDALPSFTQALKAAAKRFGRRPDDDGGDAP